MPRLTPARDESNDASMGKNKTMINHRFIIALFAVIGVVTLVAGTVDEARQAAGMGVERVARLFTHVYESKDLRFASLNGIGLPVFFMPNAGGRGNLVARALAFMHEPWSA